MGVSAYLVRSCDHHAIHMNDINQSTLPSTTMRNTHGPYLYCSIPYATTISTDSPAHCRPLCLRPYSDLSRRTIFRHVTLQRLLTTSPASQALRLSLLESRWRQPHPFEANPSSPLSRWWPRRRQVPAVRASAETRPDRSLTSSRGLSSEPDRRQFN